MAKKKYINSIVAIIENSKKTMGELFDGALEVNCYGWILTDMSLRHGPAIKKRVGRRVVLYNKAEKRIYIRNFTSIKLNDACGIRNEIEWNT